MRESPTIFLFLAVIFLTCGQKREKQINRTSLLTHVLIQASIDSTLSLDPALNTGEFLLDPGVLSSIDNEVLIEFIHQNKNIQITTLDSLFQFDSTWVRYKFFQNPVIRFEKVEPQKNGDILIQTSKYKASDGSIGTEMIFQKQRNGYKCLKCEITWIS